MKKFAVCGHSFLDKGQSSDEWSKGKGLLHPVASRNPPYFIDPKSWRILTSNRSLFQGSYFVKITLVVIIPVVYYSLLLSMVRYTPTISVIMSLTFFLLCILWFGLDCYDCSYVTIEALLKHKRTQTHTIQKTWHTHTHIRTDIHT